MTGDTITSPRLSGRWTYVASLAGAVAVAILCVFVVTGRINLSPSTAEASPKAEGYTSVGSVDGVTFWIDVRGPNEVGFRTTGRLGGICNDDAPYTETLGPYPVCAQSIQAVGSVFAFIVTDPVRNMSLPLSDGQVVNASGSLPVETLIPGHHLLVAILPLPKNQPLVSLAEYPRFS